MKLFGHLLIHKNVVTYCYLTSRLYSSILANKCTFNTPKCNGSNINLIHTTRVNHLFWERDPKGGYGKKIDVSQKKLILDGLKELKQEISMWQDEVSEQFKCDPIIAFRPGETDVVWQFNQQKDIDKWIVTSDKDHNEGHSTAHLNISPSGHGLFHGVVNSHLPIDGKIKKAGYCNIKTIRERKSFKRDAYLDWSQYNTLVIRLRGDGRNYLINLATEGFFDVTWNDVFHYVLYTRGGPYWQVARIPFSKFFLSSKGRIQDKQHPIPSNRVTSVGFSVGARNGCNGPFNLEIDYIGVEFDPGNIENFAYEMYKQDKYIVAT